ncbi:Hypothetical predicted protein [Octopus vulgaris]|uniref:Uncharacterized protein n=1 Tax=Octopus vulgaris TaxID=6645 RepID=A0AA36F7F8_OCTVU|nr:Hypothetical predicted protein [Octopus vulgaris]
MKNLLCCAVSKTGPYCGETEIKLHRSGSVKNGQSWSEIDSSGDSNLASSSLQVSTHVIQVSGIIANFVKNEKNAASISSKYHEDIQLDFPLNINDHINTNCCYCYLPLTAKRSICRFLTLSHCEILIHD